MNLFSFFWATSKTDYMNKRIQKSNSLHTLFSERYSLSLSLSLSRVRPNKYGVIFLFGSQKDSHRWSPGYINKRTPSSIRFPLRTNHKTDSTYCQVLLGFLPFFITLVELRLELYSIRTKTTVQFGLRNRFDREKIW